MNRINKTYLTKKGADIEKARKGVVQVHISAKNEAIANRRIKIAETQNARAARNAMRYVAK